MAGVDEVVVGDTLGDADPRQVAPVCGRLARDRGVERLALHLHDTYELATANLLVALEPGLRAFDGSVAGLGGCPFSPGARGNVATEKAVLLCERFGLHTGVDLARLRAAADLIRRARGTRARQPANSPPPGGRRGQVPSPGGRRGVGRLGEGQGEGHPEGSRRMEGFLFAMEAVLWLVSGMVDRGAADFRVEAAAAKLFCSERLWRAG